MAKITIDPVGRIEGHLGIEVTVEDGEVKEANAIAPMYRGFEQILEGRHPLDAQRLTQRVCGVCPTAHATASSLALDEAFGLADRIPENGRIVRNLILGSNFLQSHILHFYALAALDYVDVARAAQTAGDDPALAEVRQFAERGHLAPFVPRYEGDYRLDDEANAAAAKGYVRALAVRRLCHELLATFGGKMPHNVAIVPGGVTEQVTEDKMLAFRWRLQEIRKFIEDCYLPDILRVAGAYADHLEQGRGCGRFLCYGVFDEQTEGSGSLQRPRTLRQGALNGDLVDVDITQITEDVAHSYFRGNGDGVHPSQEVTDPEPHKEGAYSWAKSPRLNGEAHEVGPLARVLVNYAAGNEMVKTAVDGLLSATGLQAEALQSTLGRHAARALETKLVADLMAEWVLQLTPGEPTCAEYDVNELPEQGEGAGLSDAPRGALGHWIQVEAGKIARYQLVVPTTWNVSPKSGDGEPGPIERALMGTKVADEQNPFEVVRVVRSFDPCLACAVHLITPKGKDLGSYRVC